MNRSTKDQGMDAAQSRMARAALGLAVRELASKAGVSPDTVVRLEAGEDLKPSTIARVREALERLGVIFIEPNGHGPGVRLRRKGPADEGLRPDQLNSSNDG